MDLGIEGRRAAVAAASRGLGFAVADALAREGARVVICSRDRERVEAAAARIGRDTLALVADVGIPSEAAGFAVSARDALGGIDILVTNAGGPPPGTAGSVEVAQYARAFELNCLSTVAMCTELIPGMREQQWGRVLGITSAAVRQPNPALILSNVARAGVTGYLKTLAGEVAHDGVTVNSLQPGLHATERLTELGVDAATATASIPVGRLGAPGDFGAIGAFLCSEAAGFVTGTALQVDGGAYPGLL